MKISKIDNTRTNYTVLAEENCREDIYDQQTVLYQTHSSADYSGRDIRQHIMNCNEKARQLYSVLNSRIRSRFCSEKDPKYKEYEQLIRNFNAAILAALNCASHLTDHTARVEAEVKFFQTIDEQKILVSDTESILGNALKVDLSDTDRMPKRLVSENLRRSLRRKIKNMDNQMVDISELTITMIRAFFVKNLALTIQPDIIRDFFDAADNDCYKPEQMEEIAISIEKQKPKVTVCERDGHYLLIPANAEHPKKKYTFEFLQKYSASSREEQVELSRHIQQLILLYFYGPDGYLDKSALTSKKFDSQEYLSPKISELVAKITEHHSNLKEASILKNDEETKKLSKEKRTELKGKKKAAKAELPELESDLTSTVTEIMCANYRRAVGYMCENQTETVLGTNASTKAKSSADLFWIDYINDVVKKLLLDKNKKTPLYRYGTGYLCRHIWKEWTQYIAGHYIDLGKAVYHFALPDLSSVAQGESLFIGEVLPKYRRGISGFEYERIKARDSLEREMSEYASFAIHNFAQAVADDEERSKKGHEDVLLMQTEKELQKSGKNKTPITLYPDCSRRILQFFGGKTRFDSMEESEVATYEFSREDMFKAFRDELYNVRNLTFHYTTRTSAQVDHTVAQAFFNDDITDISRVFRKKYYSNNVHIYYSMDTINNLMKKIYSKKAVRQAQVPAFNHIFNRTTISRELGTIFIKGKNLGSLKNKNNILRNRPHEIVIENYWSSLFFLLKELYYYDFLQDPERAREKFLDVLDDKAETHLKELKELNQKIADTKEKIDSKATENDSEIEKWTNDLLRQETQYQKLEKDGLALEHFRKRLDEIGRDKSLGEICQELMVEYHLQNNKESKVQKDFAGKIEKATARRDAQKFKHYRSLLYVLLRNAYLSYLKDDWQILRSPSMQNLDMTEEEFCKGYSMTMYDHLKQDFDNDDITASWYVAAHFMNPKYLNHLIGSIRNYMQFTSDIEKRAASLYNRIDDTMTSENQNYHKILEILEFTMHFCGNTSHEVSDYFNMDAYGHDSLDYAKYLSQFVDFRITKANNDIETAMHVFCAEEFKLDKHTKCKVNTYYESDGKKIIPNRNVFLSLMYGNPRLLSKAMTPVTLKDFMTFFQKKSELADVLKDGICVFESEQTNLRDFQNLKNRIELVDIAVYTELLNDLQGQLINWTYLRERDLMYFQLGYYYTLLFHTDSVATNDPRRKLESETVHIRDGAMLYEIAAINSYHIPLVIFEDGSAPYILERGQHISASERIFRNKCIHGDEYYMAGLEFFENIDEHQKIQDLRNYIDHYKYFVKNDRSILDLYGECYDKLFRYDVKLKKNIPVVLMNILARYFISLSLDFDVADKTVNGTTHKATALKIRREKGLESTAFTYKIMDTDVKDRKELGNLHDKNNSKLPKEKKEILVSARSDKFVEQLKKLLESK